MTKSQFNIKISKELLISIKRQAMMSGKSLTEHITCLITNALSDEEKQNPTLSSFDKIKDLEERLLSIESIVRNREYLSEELKPFTNSEAINCTKFMRGVFYKELEKRNFNDKYVAFDDFLQSVKGFKKLKESFLERLKEIMLSDKHTPWTGRELNELTGNDKCDCSIRKGLIDWTGMREFPSQQEICDKGEDLLHLF